MLLAQSFLCLMLVPFCCCQLSFSYVIIESAVFLNVFWKKCNGRHSQSFEETKNISYYKFQCNKHFPLQIILSACSLGQEQSDNLSKTKKSRVTGYIQNSKCCDLYYNWWIRISVEWTNSNAESQKRAKKKWSVTSCFIPSCAHCSHSELLVILFCISVSVMQ